MYSYEKKHNLFLGASPHPRPQQVCWRGQGQSKKVRRGGPQNKSEQVWVTSERHSASRGSLRRMMRSISSMRCEAAARSAPSQGSPGGRSLPPPRKLSYEDRTVFGPIVTVAGTLPESPAHRCVLTPGREGGHFPLSKKPVPHFLPTPFGGGGRGQKPVSHLPLGYEGGGFTTFYLS